MQKSLKSILSLICFFALFEAIQSIEEKQYIYLKLLNLYIDTDSISSEGIISFETNMTDSENIFDVTKLDDNAKFENKIISGENEYDVTCRLWKSYNDKILVLCKMSKNLQKGKNTITFVNKDFETEDFKISIISEVNFDVRQEDYKFPFLYSEKIYLNI